MARATAVINVVGLSESLLTNAAVRLRALVERGQLVHLDPVLPAVTCSVQSSMLTGAAVREHGIVGNGWYNKELAEVQFWKQPNGLVQAEKVWETARKRDGSVTCANMCWWYNMYSSVDWSVTPRPIYKADGRKIPDCYSQPAELRHELQAKFGPFPLFRFWGPMADKRSSQWIADAAMYVYGKFEPSLTLVYLPHLDYCLQKLGPGHEAIGQHVAEVDAIVGQLVDYFDGRGVRVLVVSEYGIEPVDDAVAVNKVLREAGLLRVRVEEGLELLDAGASQAFAVADHQVAHVYAKDAATAKRVQAIFSEVDGIEQVLGESQKRAAKIDHARAGDVVLVADGRHWISYDYWLDDRRAPDFARTVDIHRKPGYDPRELFIDPKIRAAKATLAWKLLRKKLGFRQLLDVVPLDTSLVRGSHGRVTQQTKHKPVMILPEDAAVAGPMPCQAVRDVILSSMFDERIRRGDAQY